MISTTRYTTTAASLFKRRIGKDYYAASRFITSEREPATSTATNGSSDNQRRRRRHSFNMTSIPSFHDFSQQIAVRRQYRSFLRLGRRNDEELRNQIRREFRNAASTATNTQQALAEGNKRLKELQTMLQLSVNSNNSTSGISSSNVTDSRIDKKDLERVQKAKASRWPWQQQQQQNTSNEATTATNASVRSIPKRGEQ